MCFHILIYAGYGNLYFPQGIFTAVCQQQCTQNSSSHVSSHMGLPVCVTLCGYLTEDTRLHLICACLQLYSYVAEHARRDWVQFPGCQRPGWAPGPTTDFRHTRSISFLMHDPTIRIYTWLTPYTRIVARLYASVYISLMVSLSGHCMQLLQSTSHEVNNWLAWKEYGRDSQKNTIIAQWVLQCVQSSVSDGEPCTACTHSVRYHRSSVA